MVKHQDIDTRRFPIFAIADAHWAEYKSDCSGSCGAVARDAGAPLDGLANHLVDVWEGDPTWTKLGHDYMRASEMAERGFSWWPARRKAGTGTW